MASTDLGSSAVSGTCHSRPLCIELITQKLHSIGITTIGSSWLRMRGFKIKRQYLYSGWWVTSTTTFAVANCILLGKRNHMGSTNASVGITLKIAGCATSIAYREQIHDRSSSESIHFSLYLQISSRVHLYFHGGVCVVECGI